MLLVGAISLKTENTDKYLATTVLMLQARVAGNPTDDLLDRLETLWYDMNDSEIDYVEDVCRKGAHLDDLSRASYIIKQI